MDPALNLSFPLYPFLPGPQPHPVPRGAAPQTAPAPRLRRAGPDLAGPSGGRHARLEPAGPGHRPPRAHLPPRPAQPGGFHGRLRHAGGRTGHATESGARAVWAPLAAGPAVVPAVGGLRRAVLHSQHLERDGHRARPLLVHRPPPAVHAPCPQARLQRDDRAHLGTVISLAPLLFGWGETHSEHHEEGQVSREPPYAVFSTVGAFYLPPCVVLFVYWKIYKAAKLRVEARKTNSVSPMPEAVQVKGSPQQPQMVSTVRPATGTFQTDGDTWREQKEQRVALMVGILIGVFVLCWTPFFVTELAGPLCSWDVPTVWKSIFLWLGYSNSFFNPLIYTAFNKNYSSAFRSFFSRQR